MAGEWIDITVPLGPDMPRWPGDPELHIEGLALSMCLHAGTHVDAPLHFISGGAAIEELPLDATVGPARVIAIRDAKAIRAAELARHRIRRGERILFRTRNSRQRWAAREFVTDFVAVAPDAAEYLARRGVRCAGVDYVSVGACGEEGDQTHRILLAAGIWIIEGLDLSHIGPGRYDLVCLPLKIPGSDGAPARAILRRRSGQPAARRPT